MKWTMRLGWVVILAAVCAFGATTASAGLYDSWGYKAQISFSGYNKSGTLTNFPALVTLGTNISGFAYSQFLSGSNDLAFTDLTGLTNLNYEIDTWNTSGQSYVWVQVPALTSNSTIAAWWGAAGQTQPACTTNGAVWSNGYVGVWHMNQALAQDSTTHANHATTMGGAVTQTGVGIIGAANILDGNSYLGVPDSASLRAMTNGLTVSFWLKSSSAGGIPISRWGNTTGYGQYVDGNWYEANGGWNSISANRQADNAWHFYSFAGGNSKIVPYLDGASLGTSATFTGGTYPSVTSLAIGVDNRDFSTGKLTGWIDEVRVENLTRSPNWLWAEFMNMASNGVFTGYGAILANPAPQVSDVGSQNLSNTSADVTGTLITKGTLATTVYLFCATNDCTTNAANWTANGTVTTIGPFVGGAVFTNTLSVLNPNTGYFWNLMASNTAGVAWGATTVSPSFKTYGPPAVNTGAGATTIGLYSATLNGNLTSGKAADVCLLLGTVNGIWTSTNGLGVLSDAPGAFSTNVTGLTAGTTYYYQCFASNAYGTAASSTSFTTHALSGKWYVTVGGADVNDGSSWSNAFGTVQAAINAAANGDTIYLAGQIFSNNTAVLLQSQIVWTNKSLTILGGYAADGGTPGTLTNTPTVLTQPGSGFNRIFYVDGVTNGVLQGVTVAGGYCVQYYPNNIGAGLYVLNSPGLAIVNCTISNNLATSPGDYGAVYGGGLYLLSSSVTISNCLIAGNQVLPSEGGDGSYGGGIYIDGGTCSVFHCVLRGNSVGRTAQAGPCHGGGICLNAGTLTMNNCLILANDAALGIDYGDGVDVIGGTAAILSCTLACNDGVGVRQEGGTLTVANSILWGNVMDAMGTMTLAYCDVQAAGANVTQNNCLSVDPQFERGLYLAASSPCVNAGSDTAANLGLSTLTTRADGTPDSGAVDLGYHYAAGNNANVADLYVAPTGNDTTGNGSAGTPYATITKALSLQQTGTRVHVAAGTYSAVSGETLPLTITSDGAQLAGTNAALTQVSGGGSAQVLNIANSCGDGRVEGLTLANGFTMADYVSSHGAGLAASLSALTIASCVVTNNKLPDAAYNYGDIPDYGGGIYLYGCVAAVSNCVVQMNQAAVSGGGYHGCGGGLAIINGRDDIVNTIFAANVAGYNSNGSPGYGGGIYLNSVYGGFYSMRNCLVSGNTSSNGGGIYMAAGSLALCNVTVANNTNGGVSQAGGITAATNSIFWGNSGALDVTGTVALAWCDAGTIGSAVTTNTACLSADPKITGNGSYTLQKTSPCLEAGVNQSWMTGALDLAGQPRIQGPKVDMGAYEADYKSPGTTVFFR